MPTTEVFIGGSFALFFCCIVSSAAGIGGGGINVPVLLLIFGYEFKTSAKLSLCVVLGNALAQSAINLSKRHPNDGRYSLIFWELIIVLLPAQMGGSNIGTILSAIFPESVMFILAFLVLLFASIVTTRKGIHKWHDESEALNKRHYSFYEDKITSQDLKNAVSPLAAMQSSDVEQLRRSLSEDLIAVDKAAGGSSSAADNDALLALPAMRLPTSVLKVLAAMWVAYTALVVALVQVTKCSDAFIGIILVLYLPLAAAMAFGVSHNINATASEPLLGGATASDLEVSGHSKLELRNSMNDQNGSGDTVVGVPPNHFDFAHNSYSLAVFASVIGVICTLLGVGGGELYGPLMLTYKVIPQVSSATTSMMSLLNTIPSVLRYAVKGEIDYITGVILFFVGLVGGYIGRHLGLFIASKYGRPSVIIFALVGVLNLSAAYYVYEMANSDFDTTLASYC